MMHSPNSYCGFSIDEIDCIMRQQVDAKGLPNLIKADNVQFFVMIRYTYSLKNTNVCMILIKNNWIFYLILKVFPCIMRQVVLCHIDTH